VAQDDRRTPRPGPYRKPDRVDIVVVGPGEGGNAEFGALLEKLRKLAGLSRADAAAKLGLSAEYLRLIEAGKRTPALGQMPRFLDAYGAEGDVEVPQPDGSCMDLLVFLRPDDDPIFVEFRSRIREARRRGRRNLGGDMGWQGPAESGELVDERHAAELGAVVSLLTSADTGLLRRIRRMLEDELG
jgi:transcriptional regulator with XRE-family HTH domain